jgi:3-isopropylmalate dehydratase small subunit
VLNRIRGLVLIKIGDDISTDEIIPAEHRLSDRKVELLIAGSLISYLRMQAA